MIPSSHILYLIPIHNLTADSEREREGKNPGHFSSVAALSRLHMQWDLSSLEHSKGPACQVTFLLCALRRREEVRHSLDE